MAQVETDKATLEVKAEAAAARSSPPETLAGETAAPSYPDSQADASPAVLGAPSSIRADASPLAARMAGALGVELRGMSGSGPGGRVLLADIAPAALAGRQASPSFSSQEPPAIAPGEAAGGDHAPHQPLRLGRMRRSPAPRRSWPEPTVPQFCLTSHLRADGLLAFLDELNGKLRSRGVELSINDFLIKALALAIAQTPEVNVQYAGHDLLQFERMDIAVAVAVAVSSGLVTPVIRGAADKTLSTISAEARSLAARARDGELAPEDYSGGTASIFDLSMFCVDEVTPVINLPGSLIVGLGAVVERAVPRHGQVQILPMLTATAGFDHRAIDEAAAARLMVALRRLVEEPFLLAVA